VAIDVSSDSASRGSPDQVTIKEIGSDANVTHTRNSLPLPFADDVDKLGLDSGAGVTKERKAVKIVDLSGKRIKEDGGDKEEDSEDSEQQERIEVNDIDNDTSLAYEKPFPTLSFYNMTRFIMKWSMH